MAEEVRLDGREEYWLDSSRTGKYEEPCLVSFDDDDGDELLSSPRP